MSLQLAAQHLASQGRGPDSMLIHMSPKEVQSLQEIARAHGGSLSINPDTGLVEAGFLKNLLPMIAGMGITALTGGAAAPWMIGLGVGGVQAARTGSLEKGLMAGLGAYGGAGLMGGLSASAGAAEAANSASNLAGKAVPPIEQINPSNALSMGDKLKYGIQGLGTETGRGAALNALGGGFNAAKTTAMALSPALMDSGEGSGNVPKDDERYVYNYDPGRVANPNEGYTGAATGERTYFRPSYTRLPNARGLANGGVASFDEGGFTDDKNMSGLQGAAAAQGIQPFNGAVPFAQQAVPTAPTGNIQPVADNPYYKMTGQSSDAYKYLMGLGPTSGTSPTVAKSPSYATTPTTGSSEVVSAPTAPPPQSYQPPIAPLVDTDTYDQDNQDAINRLEESMREEALAESARASDIDDATISTDPVIEDTIREITPVPETPEELLNRDEFGKLEAAIAANNLDDSARASAIDDATISTDNNNTYSGFDPTSANPTIPVETLTPSPANDDELGYLTSRPEIDVAPDNGAAEAVAREQEDIAREENQRNQELMGDRQPEPELTLETAAPLIMDEIYRSADNDDKNPYYSDTTEEVQDFQNVDNSGAAIGSMAGDNSLNNDKNTYIDPVSLPPEELPDPFGSYPGDPTYIEPVQPEPVQPEPVQPEPVQPEPVQPEPVQPEPVITRSLTPEPEPVREPEPVGPFTEQEELPEEFDQYLQPEPVREPEPVGPFTEQEELPEEFDQYLQPEPEPVMPSPDEDFPSSEDYYNDFGDYGGFEGYNESDEDSYDYAGNAKGGLMAAHRYAMGGSALGGYSDGGRLLRGPGDGVSDSIPASIGRNRQPARLADGEFVVPARIVSELGNGSTEAGARKLYAMLDRIQKARQGSVGKDKVAKNTRADRYLPA